MTSRPIYELQFFSQVHFCEKNKDMTLGHWICDQKVTDSTPDRVAIK